MDPFEPVGILPSVLGSMTRGGQAVRNVLRGRPDAAGRHVVDLLGDVVDAALPGDLIPHIAKREDYVSGAELIGAEDASPAARTAANIGIELLTDPLTYIGFGSAGAAKNAVKLGVPGVDALQLAIPTAKAMDPLSLAGRAVDRGITSAAKAADSLVQRPGVSGPAATRISDAYTGAKRAVRRTLGWQDLSPEQRAVLDQARAAGATAGKVSLDRSAAALRGLDAEERVLLGDAFDALDWGDLKPHAGASRNPAVLAGLPLLDRVRALATRYGKDPAKLEAAAKQMEQVAASQWDEGIREGALRIQPGSAGRPDYLQRQFTFPTQDLAISEHLGVPGMPSAVKGRTLETASDVADYLRQNPDVGYQRDALERMATRAAQQGRLVEKARVGRALSGPNANLLDDSGDIVSTIKQVAASGDVDFADRLASVYQGLPQRGPLMDGLAKVNRYFKPAVVYGIVLPRVGSIVRNQVGMLWQAATTPGAKVSDMRGSWNALAESFDDAFASVTGSRIAKGGRLTQDIGTIEQAMAAAQDGSQVPALLRSRGRVDLAEAVEQGVMDGFVSSEAIVRNIASSPGKKRWNDLLDAPGVVFQGVEQRGRLGAFLEMRKRMSPELAGQTTRDAFLDYNITSSGNRTLRDLIPFAQFIAKSIPQQAKAISRTPAVGVGLAPLFTDPGGENGPVYPWMEGKARIPLGEAENGNPLYLSGLGLPVEALDTVPNLSGNLRSVGRDIEQGIVASAHPLAKTAYSVVSGDDPYFGTPLGSYAKNPITGENDAFGRNYQLALQTGLLAPIDVPLKTIAQATNPKRSGAVNALDVLTGAKVSEVDPDLAEQRILTQALEDRPEVKQFRGFYADQQDNELAAMMQSLRDAKKRAKARRDAAQ